MNKYLQDIIQVAHFDKQIDALEPKIAQVRKDLDDKLNQKDKILKAIENLKSECQHITLEIAEEESVIEAESQKLESIAEKQKSGLKSEREFRAIQIEEDVAKEKIVSANKKIEVLQTTKSAKEQEQESFGPELEKLQEMIMALEPSTQIKIDEVKQAQKVLFDKKQVIISQMDNKLTSFYAKIRRWAGNTSVMPVFKQACGGCFIKLSETVYSEILKGHDIISCPHCGRILYADMPTTKHTQAKPHKVDSKEKSKPKAKVAETTKPKTKTKTSSKPKSAKDSTKSSTNTTVPKNPKNTKSATSPKSTSKTTKDKSKSTSKKS